MNILLSDVGGTKTLLALFRVDGPSRIELARTRLASADYPDLETAVRSFLDSQPGVSVDRAAFAIAGPVRDDVCKATNLPWFVDARNIERVLAIPRVRLLNDFEAVAIGAARLAEKDCIILHHAPISPSGPMAVIGAGTGLGEAIIVPQGKEAVRVLPTEGGHADFAARDDLEMQLLAFAKKEFGRVSIERIVSGPGIAFIYRFLTVEGGMPKVPEAEAAHDVSAAIAQTAHEHATARDTLRLFVSLYGAEAGNFALKCLPTGGLFIAGGIAPKILPWMQDGTFLGSFFDKGRMRSVLETIPVRVIIHPDVSLLGALDYAEVASSSA